MISLLRNWRIGIQVSRVSDAMEFAGRMVMEGFEEGQALQKDGKPAPTPPAERFPPIFDSGASRRERRATLLAIEAHARAWGRAAGYQMAAFEDAASSAVETTAEEMVRDAETYANRDHP